MTASYLLRVTPCEEHGRIEAHCAKFSMTSNHSTHACPPADWCPGGSSVRVEPDYEAAAKEVGMIVRGVLKHGVRRKHAEVDSQLEGHWAGRIVGAALPQ